MSYRIFMVSVSRSERLSETFRRITLSAAELSDLAWAGVDQRVKLLLPAAGQLEALPEGDDWFEWWRSLPDADRPPMRTYTIAAHRPEAGEVDIDFAVHGQSGPASSFALSATPGERLVLVAPGRGGSAGDGVAWRPGTAAKLLCIGDETALPAIRNILATLSPEQTCDVVLEVPDASDRLPLASAARLRVEWVVRPSGATVGEPAEAALFGTVTSPASPVETDPDLWLEGSGEGADRYAWVAGEVGWVNRMRRRLAGAGYGRQNAAFMGYWRDGFAARG